MNRSHSPVYTTRGLVGSASPLAGAVGAQVMREGGNAFDAAVAVAAAEAVTLPMMCGIGGEVFALLYHAASRHALRRLRLRQGADAREAGVLH